MATIPQQQTIVQYVANASQFQYTFAFYAPEQTDIQVFYQAPNATPIPSVDQLVLNTNYTVTYNADPTTGGYITLLFTPTTGYYLTINLLIQASLTTNFASAQTFNGANLDTALDRLLMLIQQNQNYILNRNLSYVINTYLPMAQPYTQLPPLPQNFIWIGSGAGVVAAQISTVPSASVLQSQLANNSPGTDGARLVGYYDAIHSSATTVQAYLAGLLNSPTINTPIVNQGTFNQPNIVGVTDGSNATAGSVGEYIVSNISYSGGGIPFHSGNATAITSILLPPGDWQVEGGVFVLDPNNQMTYCLGWTNTSVAGIDNSLITGFNAGSTSSNFSTYGTPVQSTRYNVTTNTRIYLIVEANTLSAGTMAASGNIIARRNR